MQRERYGEHTVKKEKKIFLIYKEIQIRSGAQSYMTKGFLIYEEMRNNYLWNCDLYGPEHKDFDAGGWITL